MKAQEIATTLTTVLSAASVILILAVLLAGGIAVGAAGIHCW
jgi:hypothetical protein